MLVGQVVRRINAVQEHKFEKQKLSQLTWVSNHKSRCIGMHYKNYKESCKHIDHKNNILVTRIFYCKYSLVVRLFIQLKYNYTSYFTVQEDKIYLELGLDALAAVGTRRSAKASYISSILLNKQNPKAKALVIKIQLSAYIYIQTSTTCSCKCGHTST